MRYQCEICEQIHATQEEAMACENKPLKTELITDTLVIYDYLVFRVKSSKILPDHSRQYTLIKEDDDWQNLLRFYIPDKGLIVKETEIKQISKTQAIEHMLNVIEVIKSSKFETQGCYWDYYVEFLDKIIDATEVTSENLKNIAFTFCTLPSDFGFVYGQNFVKRLLQFIKNLSDDNKSILQKIVEEREDHQSNKDRILNLII